jgi:aquaporin Z
MRGFTSCFNSSEAPSAPGPEGAWLAFAAETLISMVLMLTVLAFMNAKKLAHYTGLAAGVLVALFITLEAPFSGMSMNPARSFASAAPSGIWTAGWIYFTAPFLGMFSAVELYRLFRFTTQRMCAKLDHPIDQRCIHCGLGIEDNAYRQQHASNKDA